MYIHANFTSTIKTHGDIEGFPYIRKKVVTEDIAKAVKMMLTYMNVLLIMHACME